MADSPSIADLGQALLTGDVKALARAITLAESRLDEHRKSALRLVDMVYTNEDKTHRIGITGIPGAGKSTFIEKLGLEFIQRGHRVAVLAVDPSSTRTHGSILGDKTRMDELSKSSAAFIRPSPSGGTLGGVAARTRESIILCEAAGFDVILIETVGTGQSETEVMNMCDTLLLLAMPGTGDELQGIKRGIMEVADMIIVHKADGDHLAQAKVAKKNIQTALHLFPAPPSNFSVRVEVASSLTGLGIAEAANLLVDRHHFIASSGWLQENRRNQQTDAFHRLAHEAVLSDFRKRMGNMMGWDDMESRIAKSKLNEYGALIRVLDQLEKA